MSTARVLALLELLQTRRRITGPEIASALQIHERTVRRDIAALSALGIPVAAERGRDGAYLLTPGYKLPPLMFGEDEALALSLGLIAARALGLASIAPAATAALAKLERVMPAAVQQRARAVEGSVQLDLRPRDHGEPDEPPAADSQALAQLTAAAQRRQRVLLHYRSLVQAETEREFDPWGLAWTNGRWYVVGHCHLRRGLRSFRLDRVQQVQPLPASFARPEAFDPLAYVREALNRIPRRHRVRVVLHASLGEVCERRLTEVGSMQALDERRTLLAAQVDDLEWFAREIAGWPVAVDVLEPAALLDALDAHARRLAADVRRSRRQPAA